MHAYTDQQKARIRGMIEAFEGCRRYLKKRQGICAALSAWRWNGDDRFQAHYDAGRLIDRALDGYAWLDSWLWNNDARSKAPLSSRSAEEMLAIRHLWLDKLIADCKAVL